jgi:hypothetical protein
MAQFRASKVYSRHLIWHDHLKSETERTIMFKPGKRQETLQYYIESISDPLVLVYKIPLSIFLVSSFEWRRSWRCPPTAGVQKISILDIMLNLWKLSSDEVATNILTSFHAVHVGDWGRLLILLVKYPGCVLITVPKMKSELHQGQFFCHYHQLLSLIIHMPG